MASWVASDSRLTAQERKEVRAVWKNQWKSRKAGKTKIQKEEKKPTAIRPHKQKKRQVSEP